MKHHFKAALKINILFNHHSKKKVFYQTRDATNPNVWGLTSLGLDLKLDLDLIWVQVWICSLDLGIGLDLV
jgi:hypothetical protein